MPLTSTVLFATMMRSVLGKTKSMIASTTASRTSEKTKMKRSRSS